MTKFLQKINLFQSKISIKQSINFTRQFASLLKTGVPYHRSLQVILNSEKHKFFRGILTKIHSEILEGKSLADSLKGFPNVFTPMYVSL